MEEYKQFWTRWSDFNGTSTLREFWIVFLINFVINAILGSLGYAANFFNTLGTIFGVVILIPQLAIGVRRFREAGHSPWNWLWGLLPIIGWIIMIVYWAQPAKASAAE